MMLFIVGTKVICIASLAATIVHYNACVHCFVSGYDVMCKPLILFYLALLVSFPGHSQILLGVSHFCLLFFCGFEADFGHSSNEITRIPYLTPMSRAMVLLVLICVGCHWLRETTPIEPLPEPHS